MSSALCRFDRSKVESFESLGFGIMVANAHGTHEIFTAPDGAAAVHGSPRLDALKADLGEGGETSSEVIFRAYQRRGAAILQNMRGAFSLAIVADNGRKVLLATDRVGIHPVYYANLDQEILFASTIHAITAYPDFEGEVDPQAIFHYLYFNMVPAPGTVYKSVARLEPGHYVEIAENRMSCKPYWQIHFDGENNKVAPDGLRTQFRETLSSGVRNAIGDNGERIGCFLSGGTDSSTVAGLVGQITGEPTRTYSIGFDADGYDELKYARIAADHFGTDHHEYYVTPSDIVECVPKIAAIYGEPFGNASVVPTYYCAKLAREDGVERLLGGDGGDELFGGNERYALQTLIAAYDAIPDLVRTAMIEPLAFGLPFGNAIPPIRMLRGYIEKAKTPMPERLEAYNFMHRMGMDTILDGDFLSTIDVSRPLDMLGANYHGANASTLVNKMMSLDMKFALADNDLPKVNLMCELARIDVTYPLLDDELVAFSARLPIQEKVRRMKLRVLFKDALRGFLPEQILRKRKHGFGLPFGVWLSSHKGLQELAYDSLGTLKSRHIVRPEFIDELLTVKSTEHPSYYGVFVWVLMMLEQWLQRRTA